VGIESFSPLGETFDPSVHEAMATSQQPPEGSQSGTVVEVYQQGYRLGSNVIRPARVVVAA
jgi:molecular chaperone GrpE